MTQEEEIKQRYVRIAGDLTERTRRLFAAKCATYLSRGIGLILIDVVTSRQANLHEELAELMGAPTATAQDRLYAVAYRPVRGTDAETIEVWKAPLAVGQALPEALQVFRTTLPPQGAVLLAYSPRRCFFARVAGDGTVTGAAGNQVDLPEIYEVRAFHAGHPTFPCDSTLNQFFTAERFDAYRTLGRFAAARALTASLMRQS